MADQKISALTSASTPLAGTEVLPIVQGGATVKVAVSNLTAGRAVSALSLTSTNDATIHGITVGTGPGSIATNTAVGNSALSVTTSAVRVTAIGVQAGATGTSGTNYSTFVGYQAGLNVTGQGNVFIGDSAGASVTTGAANTFIGGNNAVNGAAGQNMTSGSKNVILGSFNGNQGGLDIRTLDNRVVVSDGDGNPRIVSDASGIITMPVYGAGAATFSAAGVISSVSDENWKRKDGVPTNPTEMLGKLQPGYWYYNDEKKATFGVERQLGFYAQNVHAAIGPEAAPEPESYTAPNAEGVETLQQKPWGYYDRSVLAVVVMALQEALATVKALEVRIQALEVKS